MWLRISGAASRTVLERVPVAHEVGDEHLDGGCRGERRRVQRMVSAKRLAPPSATSSRFTLVMTAWRRSMRWMAKATRFGSPRSSAPGRPGGDGAEAAGAGAVCLPGS